MLGALVRVDGLQASLCAGRHSGNDNPPFSFLRRPPFARRFPTAGPAPSGLFQRV
jgi:hypothetical protein